MTDAGPGVGVFNFKVKFRDAERLLCRMFDSDYRIRLHRSRGDSGQGEAERTNSAIGGAVVDAATIEWEKYKQFERNEKGYKDYNWLDLVVKGKTRKLKGLGIEKNILTRTT